MSKDVKILMLFTLLCFFSCQSDETIDNNFQDDIIQQLIPTPNSIFVEEKFLDISQGFNLQTENILMEDKDNFLSYLQSTSLKMTDDGIVLDLILDVNNIKDDEKERYKLIINGDGVKIKASTSAGLFYGIQTLRQLTTKGNTYLTKIPYLEIDDKPKFSYRGMHFDVARHFFSIDYLKKQIDMMAYYKLNHFHWHLTDIQGWRMQINKHPELTSIAAWRTHADCIEWSTYSGLYVEEGTSNAYGGYYTQEEIKDFVEYASQRHVTIIPEIEMPGHSAEVLAVYPGLSCTGLPYTSYELCVGNDETFIFLENVLQEVIDVFPSEYIHIGGDEVDTSHWRSCPKCQKRMKLEGLKNESDLQVYLINRITDFLKVRNRKPVVWYESLSNVSEEAIAMIWRDKDDSKNAIKKGHNVIMAPSEFCYFDYYQGSPATQPKAMGGYLPIEKVYSFKSELNDISSSEMKNILGVQANLWTEYISTESHADYMIWPRLLALSEIAWNNQKQQWRLFFRPKIDFSISFLQNQGFNPCTTN